MSSGDESEDDDDSTLNAVIGIGEERRATHGLWLRRGMVALMVILIVAAGTGFLGVRSATESARTDGYQVTVTYARIARAGLDVPFRIRVQAPHDIDRNVVIAIPAAYFRIFETQGFFPEPSDVTSDGDSLYFTFSPPPAGNVLVVDYDGYIQPAAQIGASASIRVQVDGTWRVATVVHTTLIP